MSRTEILLALEEHRIGHVEAEHLLAGASEPQPDAYVPPPMTLVEAARIAAGPRTTEGWLR